MLNKLLERQLRRYLKGDGELSAETNELLLAISNTYDHFEQDRTLLERSLEISSSELTRANKKMKEVNRIIEEKNKDLTDSINYARMIQEAIFPPQSMVKRILPNSFIFYRPKEIVSGDFYWLDEINDRIYLAAVDCTGHGVPGAFMSIVGQNLLNDAVREHKLTKPSEILDWINLGLNKTLRQSSDTNSLRDGMDIAFCCIDKTDQTIAYAGAYNPMYLFRDGVLLETKADKFPIGISFRDSISTFKNHEMKYQKGDVVYIFTDGFPDQFGGPMGKKYKYDRFQTLLKSIHEQSIHEQGQILEKEFWSWKGDLVQIDDILIIGFTLD